ENVILSVEESELGPLASARLLAAAWPRLRLRGAIAHGSSDHPPDCAERPRGGRRLAVAGGDDADRVRGARGQVAAARRVPLRAQWHAHAGLDAEGSRRAGGIP